MRMVLLADVTPQYLVVSYVPGPGVTSGAVGSMDAGISHFAAIVYAGVERCAFMMR